MPYRTTTPAAREAKRRGMARWHRRNVDEIQRYKSKTPCADCGELLPHYCMDFDHVRGTKKFEMNRVGSKTMTAIRKEIRKCDLVCAICHRKRTYKRQRAA